MITRPLSIFRRPLKAGSFRTCALSASAPAVLLVIGALLPQSAFAAGYPKAKVPGTEYFIQNGPVASTPAQAGMDFAASYGTVTTSYTYNCNQPTYCVAYCYGRLDFAGFNPFTSGSVVTSGFFTFIGEVAQANSCGPGPDSVRALYRNETMVCPPGFGEDPQNSQQCICQEGTAFVDSIDACRPVRNRFNFDDGNSCKRGPGFGKPIFPTTGSKRFEIPVATLGSAAFSLVYDSRRRVAANLPNALLRQTILPSFGTMWESSYHRTLVFDSNTDPTTVYAWRGSSRVVSFVKTGAPFLPGAGTSDRLARVGQVWRYIDHEARTQELYNGAGQLVSMQRSDGLSMTFTYSNTNTPQSVAPAPGLLIEIRDSFDRTLRLTYEQPPSAVLKPRVRSLTDSASRETKFAYDTAGNLKSIVWPDSTSRQFLYENGQFPWAVTGVVDERPTRVNTITYDASGRAYETLAVGAVDHYRVTWATPPSVFVVSGLPSPVI